MLIQGKAYWSKLLGEPIRNEQYPENPRTWSIDVTVDGEAVKALREAGLYAKVKNKGDDRGQFITLKRKEFKADGVTKNQPVKVVDHRGNPWKKDVLIGNGSTVNVRFNVYKDKQGRANPAILAVQVWDLVKYEAPDRSNDDFPVKDTEGDVEFV